MSDFLILEPIVLAHTREGLDFISPVLLVPLIAFDFHFHFDFDFHGQVLPLFVLNLPKPNGKSCVQSHKYNYYASKVPCF